MTDGHEKLFSLDSYGTLADSRDEGKVRILPKNSLVLLSDVHSILCGATHEEIASIIETKELPIYRHIKTARNDKNEEITFFKDINEYVSYDIMLESPKDYVAKSKDVDKLRKKYADYFYQLISHDDEQMIPAKFVRERVTALETEKNQLCEAISFLQGELSKDVNAKRKTSYLQVLSAFFRKIDIDISEENHNRVTVINKLIENNRGNKLSEDTIRTLCREVENFRSRLR